MKKLVLAVLALSTFTACNNDDDSTNEASIVGTWKIDKYITYDGENNAVLETEYPNVCQELDTFIFTSDNQLKIKEHASMDGSCEVDSEETGTYTYNENTQTLTVILSGTEETNKVEKLTSTEFNLVAEEEDVNNDGVLDKVVMFLKK